MDEEIFNMEVRKFLKKVGVTAQREIEAAVRKAIEDSTLTGREELNAKVVLTIDKVGLAHEVESTIKLA